MRVERGGQGRRHYFRWSFWLRKKCSDYLVFFLRDMAPVGKKAKKSRSKKQASQTISGLPEQLYYCWRIRNETLGGHGVSKSWRSMSKKCNNKGSIPQLQLISPRASRSKIQVEEDGKSDLQQNHLLRKIMYLPGGFYASGSRYLSVWTAFGPCTEWWFDPEQFALASTSFIASFHMYIPRGGGIMVLTGLSHPALLFLRRVHELHVQIERLDRTIIDPYDSEKQAIIFTNAIGFKGKFYALSLHGALAVVEDVDSRFTIIGFGKNRAVPSVPSRSFIEYLIESNEELLLVFLISRKSISSIDYVEVFKLDLVTLSWVKMNNLEDRALFLAGTTRCMSFSANQVTSKGKGQFGYKSNHVYFTHQGINCWKEFDMESRSISPSCCNF